ncbi:GNAT family N-acetyltransferase [Leptospira stimsonii]|uniref:N-acetyltransferase n=1 Tax=Leptospira stimsonii TaxID=2202203 RepID=A0A4R9L694_9LEPT|nr:GNAT family N-acetyltransferase [Leptospira stimsonii]RHX88562.1 GNAT family N-acetyltransferase [Leptospira stimsonii]RHX92973.1 GNAT family N-acetyltransferase [Leptospira stimsonii]TGK22945.1 N-acetyltransferase [Leptospira stimsonii]TGM16621.1 N-acetyltransferase [Leptospira stimsonii]
MSSDIIHSEKEFKFYTVFEGIESHLFYRDQGNIWDLVSTYVPSELRGKGIAADLVKTTLDKARSLDKKIVPSCSYVATFLERHPDYQDLVAK